MSKLLLPWAYGLSMIAALVGLVNYGFAWDVVARWVSYGNIALGGIPLLMCMSSGLCERYVPAGVIMIAIGAGASFSLGIVDVLLIITGCAYLLVMFERDAPKRGLPCGDYLLSYGCVLFGGVSGNWVLRDGSGEDFVLFLLAPLAFLALGYAYRIHWLTPHASRQIH